MCIYLCLCAHMCAGPHVLVHAWCRDQKSMLSSFPHHMPSYFLRQVFQWDYWFDSLSGQWTLGILQSLPPQCWDYRCTLLNLLWWMLGTINLSLHACMARALYADLSLIEIFSRVTVPWNCKVMQKQKYSFIVPSCGSVNISGLSL